MNQSKQNKKQSLKQAVNQLSTSLAKTAKSLISNTNKKKQLVVKRKNGQTVNYDNFLQQKKTGGNDKPMVNNSQVFPIKQQPKRRPYSLKIEELADWEKEEIARYAVAMSDPFSIKQTDLPHMPLLAHQSIRNYASGTFYTNAAGFGSITVHPDYCVSNDQTFAVTASSATSPNTVVSSGIAPALQFTMNGPYPQSAYQLGTEYGLQFRIVSLGIRIRYMGSVVNAAGTCYTIEMEPKASTDSDPFAGFEVKDIKAAPTWKEYSIMNGTWHAVTRHILSTKDFDYKGLNTGTGQIQYAELFATSTTSLDQCSNIAIAIQCTDSQPFEFEVVCHFEVVGDGLPTRTVVSDQSKHVAKINSNLRKVQAADNTTPAHSVDGVDDVVVTNPQSWLSSKTITPLVQAGLELLGDFLF